MSGRPPRKSLAAELALGVLDPDERRDAEVRAAADPAFAAEAAGWAARLHPLTEEVAPLAPTPGLWLRILAGLPAEAPAPVQPMSTPAAGPAPASAQVVDLVPRRRLTAWRWATAASSALAAACVAALVFTGPRAPPAALLAAKLAPAQGSAAILTSEPLFTVTLDTGRGLAVLTPVTPGPSDPRVRELWLIPKGGKPIAAGLLDLRRTAPLRLSPTLLAEARSGATLAVSLEPPGGSPGPAPTGPVIASGVLARI